MFIDIHAHVQRYPERVIQRFPTADELVALYDKLGIEKGVILPVVTPEIYLPQTNEDILDAAQKYPDRLIPYCNVDPTAYNAFARDDEYGPQFMEEFCDRLYFGTDICGPGLPQYIVDMINLLTEWRDSKKISETSFNKIARENAIKLLEI